MRYGQITTSRLSRAAKKLRADGDWHRLDSNPLGWYRVWRNRIVQRATFEDEAEVALFLPLLPPLEPLELAVTGGFREELNIRVVHNQLEIAIPLGYREGLSKALYRAMEIRNISLTEETGLLFAHFPLESLTTAALAEVQERIALLRTEVQVGQPPGLNSVR